MGSKAYLVTAFVIAFMVMAIVPWSMTANVKAEQPVLHTVWMTDDLKYEPATLKINPGDTVVWKNKPGHKVTHTVTAYQDKLPQGAPYFASGNFTSESQARQNVDAALIPADGEYRHTFTVNGTYEYFCIPHEAAGMIGYIMVGEGQEFPSEGASVSYLMPILVGTVVVLVVITAVAFWSIRRKREVP